MNKKMLFTLWGVLYALCALLGFASNPSNALGILMTMLALAFFLPPLLLIRSGEKSAVLLVRNLAAIWLFLTVVLIISNILSVNDSVRVGNILYTLLIIISSPMICARYWVLAIFGWAYLLFDSINKLKKA